MTSRNDILMAHIATLPAAKAYHRQDWGLIYFDLDGKCFGLLTLENATVSRLTLKNTPDKNQFLRDFYQGVTPGYHINKRHWITLYFDQTDLTLDEVKQLIIESYTLVKANLTKARRQALALD